MACGQFLPILSLPELFLRLKFSIWSEYEAHGNAILQNGRAQFDVVAHIDTRSWTEQCAGKQKRDEKKWLRVQARWREYGSQHETRPRGARGQTLWKSYWSSCEALRAWNGEGNQACHLIKSRLLSSAEFDKHRATQLYDLVLKLSSPQGSA